ncbi:MAG: helix-turn-helix domain-containing protein [Parcubacteria group bacterium]|jgi:sugar-specific transcriptional regulator TrmB
MENNSLENLLELGFLPNEARVYLACLELGKGTVTQISKKAGLNRTTGYDILERLSIKGLVNMALAKGKKRFYSALSPSRLKQYLRGKRNLYDKRLEKLEKTLPKLKLLYKETEMKPVIKIAEGVEALKQMACLELDTKNIVYSFANLTNYAETFSDMGKERTAERLRRGIKERCLSIDSEYARDWWQKNYGGKKRLQEMTEYRWIKPDSNYSTAGEIIIFDDTVVAILSKTSDNVAFEIKSETFANFLKILFESAWQSSRKSST